MVKAGLVLFSIVTLLTNAHGKWTFYFFLLADAWDYRAIICKQSLQEFCLKRLQRSSPSATWTATAGLSASHARSVLAAMAFVIVAALERRWRLMCSAKQSRRTVCLSELSTRKLILHHHMCCVSRDVSCNLCFWCCGVVVLPIYKGSWVPKKKCFLLLSLFHTKLFVCHFNAQ